MPAEQNQRVFQRFVEEGLNKKNIQGSLFKLEQRLAHIRENLDTRQLAKEFDRAQHLKKT